ncbi:MAG: hypothetical protein WAK31_31205 [Chthoniobacterales bacterium]
MAKKRVGITWAQAFRDLGVRFFSSGIFIPTLGAIVVLCLFLRAPPEKLPEVAKIVFEKETTWMILAIIGWSLAIIITICAVALALFQRKLYSEEMSRVTKERDKLQERLLAQPVQHSRIKEGK